MINCNMHMALRDHELTEVLIGLTLQDKSTQLIPSMTLIAWPESSRTKNFILGHLFSRTKIPLTVHTAVHGSIKGGYEST